MNKIVLLGKLIRNPELKVVEGTDKIYTKFIIAVERNFKSSDGDRKADLIPVTLWGRKAEVVCKYLKKGDLISLSGRLRTGSYEDKTGLKKYIAQVVAEDFRFVGNKKNNVQDEDIETEEG